VRRGVNGHNASDEALALDYAMAGLGSSWLPIAQIKPTSSRAMAVMTMVFFLPRASMRRNLPRNLISRLGLSRSREDWSGNDVATTIDCRIDSRDCLESAGQDVGVISTVEPFLMRGLDTAYGALS
jgi:hypothetical protein